MKLLNEFGFIKNISKIHAGNNGIRL